MGMSRREVLTVGTVVALSAGLPWLPGGYALAEEVEAPPLSVLAMGGLSGLTRADFAGSVGSRFQFHTSGGGVATRLVRVAATRGPERDPFCFALRFRSRATQRLAQGTYLVEHPVLGEFALFVVPMGAKGRRAYYEAVINRAHA